MYAFELYLLTASKIKDNFSLLGRLAQEIQDGLLNEVHSEPVTSMDQG